MRVIMMNNINMSNLDAVTQLNNCDTFALNTFILLWFFLERSRIVILSNAALPFVGMYTRGIPVLV